MSRGFNLWATLVVCLFLISFNVNSQTPVPGYAGQVGGGCCGPFSFTGGWDVFVVGNYAYHLSQSNQLVVIDVTNPTNPSAVGIIANGSGGALLNSPSAIWVDGNYAFVTARNNNALEIVNISNPQAPAHSGSISDGSGPSAPELTSPTDVKVVGNYAYVVAGDGLEIVDITTKTAPVHSGKVSLGSLGPPPETVDVVGNYAYVAGFGFLAVIDVTSKTTPTLVGSILQGSCSCAALLGYIKGIQVVGNYAFMVSQTDNALEIVNISTPTAPTHAASFTHTTGGAVIQEPSSIKIVGNYAYITNQTAGQEVYEIVDISNPLAPSHATKLVGSGNSPGGQPGPFLFQSRSSFVVGNYAYITFNFGLEIEYLFTPIAPKLSFASGVTSSDITLNWYSSQNILNYNLDVSTDNFSTFLSGYNGLSIPSGTTSATLTGLAAGTDLQYRLSVTNVNGTSAYAVSSASTLPPAPIPVVSNVTFDSYTVTWPAISGAAYYEYAYGQAPDLLQNPPLPLQFSPGNSVTVLQQLPGTQFTFIVRAKNGAGSGPLAGVTVVTRPLPPAFETSNEFGLITQTSFKANWILNPMIQSSLSIDVATDAAFVNIVTGYNDLSLPISNSLTVNGLQPNTTYYVRLRAINASGPSASSSTGTVVTLPAAMTATASTLSAANSFRANWTEVSGVSKYWIDVSTVNTFDVLLTSYNNRQISAPASGLVVDTGLDPGATYYYRVRCQNTTGLSPNSNVISATTLPLVPTLNNATAVTLTTFDASWLASTGATGYFLDVATDAGFTSFVAGFNNKSVGNVTTTTVDGLTASTTYNYRLRASNAGGATASSAVKTVVTAPPAPVASAASNVGQTSFTANWAAVTGVSDYRIDVSFDNAFATQAPYNNTLVSGTTSFLATGLIGGTTYYYRVRAVNTAPGSTSSSSTSASSNVVSQLTIPATPTTSPAAPVGQTSFTAVWNSVTGATEYFVDVKDSGGAILTGYNNVSVATGSSLAVNTGVASGTTYSYVVRAKNAAGTSPSSSAQSVLTVPPTPVAGAPTGVTTSSFSANWNASTGATKYFITVANQPDFALGSIVSVYNSFDVGLVTTFNVSVPASTTGATYYFKVSAGNGSGQSPFSSSITVNTPVTSFPAITLPTGGKVENYTIISIPAGVTPVTTLNADAFGTTWRIMHYDNATDKNVDVKAVNRENLKVGEGYWVNSNLDQAPTITMTGESLPTTQTITLAKGWNQIGNPFSFGISWADVKAKNTSATGVEDLFVYDRAFAKSDALFGYSGGFVNNTNSGSVTLTIPTNVVRAGRTASQRHEIEGRDITDDEWFLPLTLESAGQTNDLGGLGMHPQAKTSHDRFDAIALPRFFNLSEFSTSHPEFFQPHFMTDVVPTTPSYTWTFNISSEETDARLSWDNTTWTGGALYLIDDEAGALLDMSKASSYSFDPRRTRSIKFAFGRDGQFTPEVTGLGQPFPNPSTDRVTFPFIGQPGQTININVLDLTGHSVGSMRVENARSGYNEAVWDATDTRVSPGVYLYQFITSTGIRKTGRIVLK